MQDHIVIGGELQLRNTIDGDLALHSVIDGDAGIFMPIFPEAYAGPTTVTPGPEAQTLNTSGLMLPDNITIEPIPNNYGLITWDGSTLTVS